MSEKKDEEGFVKYGVQFEDKVKTAEKLDKVWVCPWCKKELVSVDPPQCGEHGTEPFEKR